MKECCWDAWFKTRANTDFCPTCGAEIDMGLDYPLEDTLALLQKTFELSVIDSTMRDELRREAQQHKNTGYVFEVILTKTQNYKDSLLHLMRIIDGVDGVTVCWMDSGGPSLSAEQDHALRVLSQGISFIRKGEYLELEEQVRLGRSSDVVSMVRERASERIKDVSFLQLVQKDIISKYACVPHPLRSKWWGMILRAADESPTFSFIKDGATGLKFVRPRRGRGL